MPPPCRSGSKPTGNSQQYGTGKADGTDGKRGAVAVRTPLGVKYGACVVYVPSTDIFPKVNQITYLCPSLYRFNSDVSHIL